VYPYEENDFFLLILNVFLVRVHFFYSFLHFFTIFQISKELKKCTLTRKMYFFLLILTVFLVRVHFLYSFLLFFRFQKSKKSVPLRGKCTFFTNLDCFPRKRTRFLLFFFFFSDFKSVKKVYLYEENALFLLILPVFLVRVHFFNFFFIFQISKCKKSVPLGGK